MGIDIGTTGVKCIVLTPDGECKGFASCVYEIYHPVAFAAEQRPSDWWDALVDVVKKCCGNPEIASNVAAISISSQGGTVVPVNKAMKPLSNALVWSDCRCAAQRDEYNKTFGEDCLYQKSGWWAIDGQPAFQIKRLAEESPDLFRDSAYFLTVSDYLIMRLSGELVIDFSNAGINQLIDVRQGIYDPDILGWLGIGEEQLPELVPSGKAVGRLLEEAASQLGLPAGVVVVSGAHDQYAAMAGAGITSSGTLLVGTGTAWVACALSKEPSFDTRFAQSRSASEGWWGALASIPNGGCCLSWLKNQVICCSSYEDIDREANKKPVGSNELRFHPRALDDLNGFGEAFRGLRLKHDRYDMARAVMEGICFSMRSIALSFLEHMKICKVVFSGGAARSRFWSQLACDIIGYPLAIPMISDISAVGAAVLAGAGSGMFSSVEEASEHMRPAFEECLPDDARKESYKNLYLQYMAADKANDGR